MATLRCALVLAVVTAALTAGAASAKGPNVATICGASECKTVRGELSLLPILDWMNRPFSLRDAPKTAPYYVFRLRGRGIAMKLVYAPSRRSMRIWSTSDLPGQGEIGPYWRNVPRDAAERLDRFVRGLEPFPASRGWPR